MRGVWRRSFSTGALLTVAATIGIAVPAGAAQTSDGRVYEQVSPVQKFGSGAGAGGSDSPSYGVAAADGSGIFYGVGGPIGSATRGMQNYAIGRRSGTGWSADNPFPLPSAASINYLDYQVQAPWPSEGLGSVAYQMSGGGLVPGNPAIPGHINGDPGAEALYRADSGGMEWLSRPTVDPAVPSVGSIEGAGLVPAGASENLDTFYFSYYGTLVPEDAPRAPLVSDKFSSPWGFYRYAEGHLEAAGVLPDGTLDPYGAIPAGAAAAPGSVGNFNVPMDFRNQVSADGTRAFFVSPDPNAGSGMPSQLYVRKNGTSTVLVSRSALTGDPAPDGVAMQQRMSTVKGASYAFGSRDGSHVYFQSVDQLTADAPDDGTKKAYVFDVDDETTEYLPGVQGDVLAASDDLSRFLYASTAAPTLAGPLGVWADGHATPIATRDRPTVGTSDNAARRAWISQGRASADGSVFVFQSNSPLPGPLPDGFNNTSGYEEVYRYDVATSALSCLSCAPAGDVASGNSHLSDNGGTGPATNLDGALRDNRAISTDGKRVFFATSNALVDRDTNGKRDVYVEESGSARLISSGLSPEDSYLLDNSASGDDVFFATTEGLSEDDRDGSYDVYDARVGGGFPRPAVPPVCPSNCRPPTGGAPAALPPGTLAPGAGNVADLPPAPAKVTVTRKSSKGSTVSVSLKVPGAGAVTASGEGLGTVKRSVLKGGTYRLSLKLTKKARRALARERRLRVHVHLRYRPMLGFPADAVASLTVKTKKGAR